MDAADKKKISEIESLAKEAIRCAIGELQGTTKSERALEALKKFQTSVSAEPALLIDLIREWRLLTQESFTP